jgi:D-beta-D-heptose 7-phosphate kinase/D-beta-D-heptose 1-phosphate adenosyltransferase
LRRLRPARARRLLRSLRGRRLLVVGDLMLDEFLWGRAARLSPEAPVPVVQVTRESFHVGGAGNVAANVCALGGEAVLAGVVGEDEAAERLREGLRACGVLGRLVPAPGRPTTLKTRIIAQHQQVVRADRERSDELGGDVEAALIEAAAASVAGCHAVIVSDYDKGVVTRRLVRALVSRARRRGIPVLVDPKVRHLARYRGASVVTPNQLEAAEASGMAIVDEPSLAAAGRRLLGALRCRAVLITRGERGMARFERGREPLLIPAAAREVFDVTGAGDTVIATLGLALAAGAELGEAAALANAAAGVVVAKLGTATAEPEELLQALQGDRG